MEKLSDNADCARVIKQQLDSQYSGSTGWCVVVGESFTVSRTSDQS